MSETETYTIDEAHALFAKRLNGEVWHLLDSSDRTTAEAERMLAAAYASQYHWLHVGDEVNQQRGEWLVAHVYTVLENANMAKAHAIRCLEWTEEFKDNMADFDIAYAYEGLARAYALDGDVDQAKKYLQLASKAGDDIDDISNKKVFKRDLESGPWHGLR